MPLVVEAVRDQLAEMAETALVEVVLEAWVEAVLASLARTVPSRVTEAVAVVVVLTAVLQRL